MAGSQPDRPTVSGSGTDADANRPAPHAAAHERSGRLPTSAVGVGPAGRGERNKVCGAPLV
jgi:hypothetical protein